MPEPVAAQLQAQLKVITEEIANLKDASRLTSKSHEFVVYSDILPEKQANVYVRQDGPHVIYTRKIMNAFEGYCVLSAVGDNFKSNLGQQHMVEVRDGWWVASVFHDVEGFTIARCWRY